MSNQHFDEAARTALYQIIDARRDMRHFQKDAQVSPEVFERLLHAAHAAPSVGFMQPWRFLRITDGAVRKTIHALVQEEREATAAALGAREGEFLQLKVEGILDCAELLVVALCDQRDDYVFGRRTLPEMDLASTACAIQNLWLAARAENLGMGWVSLFEPKALKALLRMPEDSQPVAILCLGPVTTFYDTPMLEQSGWDSRRELNTLLMENAWQTRDR